MQSFGQSFLQLNPCDELLVSVGHEMLDGNLLGFVRLRTDGRIFEVTYRLIFFAGGSWLLRIREYRPDSLILSAPGAHSRFGNLP